ncbi:MAG: hypothetical protein HOV81_06530 [Kofleriaceae bacterium]|nr:hypothetical protein [Kofleriaceae bacterium]
MVGCYGGERRNTGECPAGETCSDLTPGGLDFVGNHLVDDILLSGPRATAIGGTQQVALEYDRGDGIDVALDMPFTADDDGGNGIRVDSTSGSQVTIRGAGSRSNYLRILDEDGLLMDRKELTGAALESIELVTTDFESVPAGAQLAFAAGPRKVGVALYGDVQHSGGPTPERLVDTSMVLALQGAERTAWDTLEVNAQVGTYPLAVTAGDKPTATLDFIVVDHADALAAISPMTTVPPSNTGSTSLCFQATTSGRYIAGLSWSFLVDGETITHGNDALTRNCISVSTQKTSGTVSVQANAGGQSTTLTLNVGAAARSRDNVPMRTAAPAVTTAGDRASL